MKKRIIQIVFVLGVMAFPKEANSQCRDFLDSLKVQKFNLPLRVTCSDLVTEVNPGFEFLEYLSTLDSFTVDTLSPANFNYFFQNLTAIPVHNIWSLDTLTQRSLPDFYRTHQVYLEGYFSITDSVYAVIVDYCDDDGMEKVLFTLDEKMNVIDKLPLAFYVRHGSYTEEDGSKGVWWTQKSSVVLENYRVVSDASHHQNFQILLSGSIHWLD